MESQPYSVTGKFVENLKTTKQNSSEKDNAVYSKYIPKHVQKNWKSLFSKQLYGLGKDILHTNNLLLQYGFTKQRPPVPSQGSSQYSFSDQNVQMIMWGFGMIFAIGNNGLFLWRHDFVPKLLNVDSLPSHIWEPEQISKCKIPKTLDEIQLMLQLLVKSMKWLESYEKWINSTCGESYRGKSLQSQNSSSASSVFLDQKWSELNEKFEKILKNSEPEQNSGAINSEQTYETIESKSVQLNFEQSAVIPKKTCGACGENYPEDIKFCPSCSWEELPC